MLRCWMLAGLMCLACGRIGFDSNPDALGNLTLTSPTRLVNANDVGVFSGTCLPGAIDVTGTETQTFPCESGLWTFTTASATSDDERDYVFSQGSASASATWIRDTIAPTLTPGSMLINEGAAETRSVFVQAALAAVDERTSVIEYCVQPDSTEQPAAESPCWSRIDSPAIGGTIGPSISVSGLPARLGFVPGDYNLYAWVRDEALNASVLSNGALGTSGQDTAMIHYRPAIAPTIDLSLLANTNTPGAPALPSEVVAPAGTTMFIKWRAADDDALDSNPISIYWTEDDESYQLIASDLLNAANGACVPDEGATSADDGATGCYVWNAGSPISTYYRVRVVAEDIDGGIGFGSSSPVNTGSTRFIAGNVDPGSGTSASGAMFVNTTATSIRDFADPGSLLVGSLGTVYFRDADRGLLVVDPQTGIQRVLVPTTGIGSGDDGPASAATFELPLKIAFDEQERVLVFDHDRIRRINTNLDPPTIETLIGGGASKADGVGALEVEITATGTTLGSTNARQMPLFALTNGDIYFQSEGYLAAPAAGSRFRVFHADTGLVSSITVSGTDTVLTPGQDLAECPTSALGVEFDTATSALTYAQVTQRHNRSPECLVAPDLTGEAYYQIDPASGATLASHPTPHPGILRLTTPIQGRDGRLYILSRHESRLLQYDPIEHDFDAILGSGQLGICADGTPALDCAIDISDAFISVRSEVYFMDRGRLRAIDENGEIVTLMGQPRFFGDGLPPLMARFGSIANLDVWNDGSRNRYLVLDSSEFRFREVSEGLTVAPVAGNGANTAPSGALPAVNDSIYTDGAGVLWTQFGLDQSSGDIYYNRGAGIVSRLVRATGLWVDFVGGGTTPLASADGAIGSDISIPGFYRPLVLGADDADVVVATEVYDTNSRLLHDALVTSHRYADGRQATLVGVVGEAPSSFCTPGTNPNSCAVPASRYHMRARQTGAGRWVLGRVGQPTLHVVGPASVDLLATAPRSIAAFDLEDSGDLQLYYCSTTGFLHHYDVVADIETPLAMPSPDMRCRGQAVKYMAASNSLVFSFSQNGLSGLAEYLLP